MSAVKPFTIPKRLVSDAWKAVKANAGSAGVDKETMARASERDGVLLLLHETDRIMPVLIC
jgi:hypothetical protein